MYLIFDPTNNSHVVASTKPHRDEVVAAIINKIKSHPTFGHPVTDIYVSTITHVVSVENGFPKLKRCTWTRQKLTS